MSLLPVKNIEPDRGGVSNRDARALDRLISSVNRNTAGDLAKIDAAGRKWEEILTVNTGLTTQAMRDTVLVAQAQALGTQIAPHAGQRLAYLAEQHVLQESDILTAAHRALGRLAR